MCGVQSLGVISQDVHFEVLLRGRLRALAEHSVAVFVGGRGLEGSGKREIGQWFRMQERKQISVCYAG
jgi:hypothetical protein